MNFVVEPVRNTRARPCHNAFFTAMTDPKPAQSPSPTRHAWMTLTVVVSLLLGASLRGDDLLYERFGEYLDSLRAQPGIGIPGLAAAIVGHQRHRLGARVRQAGPEPVPAAPGRTRRFTSTASRRCSPRRWCCDASRKDCLSLSDRVGQFEPSSPDANATLQPIADPLVGDVRRPGVFLPPGTPRAVVDCREGVQCRLVPQDNGEPARTASRCATRSRAPTSFTSCRQPKASHPATRWSAIPGHSNGSQSPTRWTRRDARRRRGTRRPR